MEFRWTEEEERFRREIRDLLDKELPPDWQQHAGEDDSPERADFEKAFASKMGQRGWLTVGWPKEYGGMGWSPLQQMIFNEEMSLHKAPRRYMGAGVGLAGPSIMTHGSDDQKKRFLPPIAHGEVVWCQLFSEPNAGSDLASLQTTAEDQGDYFVVNGQKTWTTAGQYAQWGVLLARSDQNAPKHKGISYLLVDMSSPGITRRPIINMADVHHFNEFYFDDVKVPKDCLIGEKNLGWYVGTTTLNFERSGIGNTLAAIYLFQELIEYAKTGAHGYHPLQRNPVLRHRLADMAIQLQTSRKLAYRIGWLQSQGIAPSHEASASKLFTSEMTQRLVQLGMEVLGHWGEPTHESTINVLRGKIQKLYRGQRAITIGAGTSEVQRNVLAMRGLGLPRG